MNTVVDLFSGCGGLSLGFEEAGFTVLAAFDKWKPAIDVYKNNFQHPIFECDLSNDKVVKQIKELNPEIIIGGPPCQDFSSAGKRDETLGRADLTVSYAQIIAAIKPKWFLMENVARIEKSSILKEAIDIFKNNNYGITKQVLNASFYGVPQRRKRFFMIGRLGGQDNELDFYLSKNKEKKETTLVDFFGDSLGVEFYYRHPRSYARRGIFSIYEPSPTIRGVNRPMPKTYKKHNGDRCEPSDKVRALTTIERSYIQTFPKKFNFTGTKSNLEQMIGNAVPVKLAKHVAQCITEFQKDLKLSKVKKVNKYGQLELEMK